MRKPDCHTSTLCQKVRIQMYCDAAIVPFEFDREGNSIGRTDAGVSSQIGWMENCTKRVKCRTSLVRGGR